MAFFQKERPEVKVYGSVDLDSVLRITEEAKQNPMLKKVFSE